MPVIHTRSATPLAPATLETGRAGTTHVWLRKNIKKTTEMFEGEPYDVWEADEVYLHLGTPVTAEYVDIHFETLWAQEANRTTPPTLEALVGDLFVAVGELGALVAGGDL